uniref:Secreted protein n=1 Tax=Steinernema glaseri TaxID=37863 RepID=A0A1I7Z7M3_9BILA
MSVITFISLVASVLLVVSGKPLSSQPDAAVATKGDESLFRKILEGGSDPLVDLKNGSATLTDPKDLEQVEENLRNTRDELLETLAKNADVKLDERTNEPIRLISERVLQQTLEQIFENHQRKAGAENAEKVLTATVEPSTTPGNETDADTSSGSSSNSISSRIICQFFVFGTLFGVPRSATDVNPSNVPAPIDYNKPYQLKCDSKGQCYASPLNDDEIPPLPTYDIALTMPSTPLSEKDKKPSKEALEPTSSPSSPSSQFY